MKKDIVTQTNEVFENTTLYRFLGEEHGKDFQLQVKEIILERIKEDVAQYPYYLLSTDDVQDAINSVVEEAKQEIIEEYKEEIKKALVEAILKGLNKDLLKEILVEG